MKKKLIFRIKYIVQNLRTKFLFMVELWIDKIINYKWNNYPFGKKLRSTREVYFQIFEKLKNYQNQIANDYMAKLNYDLEKEWLYNLALHTQVVIKDSDISIDHGRLLYGHLRKYLEKKQNRDEVISILETGTARGFSAICMAKALEDQKFNGTIYTMDIIPHNNKFYWNCIDDTYFKKSRKELLEPWLDLTKKYIFFISGNSKIQLNKIHTDHLHFAFLDGAHTFDDLKNEFNYVNERQEKGDIIFLDDYNDILFPELVRAINKCCDLFQYEKKIIDIGKSRKYVLAMKKN